MKSKIFKKFFAIDQNEYYFSIIGGEFYLAIRTFIDFVARLGPFKWKHRETQYLKTVKIPPSIQEFMRLFATLFEGAEEHKDWPTMLDDMRSGLKRDVIMAMYDVRESELTQNPDNENSINKFYADRLLQIYDTYELSWENDTVKTYLKDGWTFLMQIYAGVATRNIWLAQVNDDLITFMELKAFGNAKASVIVKDDRLLLNKTIIDAFINAVEGGN